MARIIDTIWKKLVYKPGSSEVYWEKLISSGVVIGSLIVFSIVKNNSIDNSKKKLDRLHRFSIGTTTNYHNNIRSSHTAVYFEFRYLGTTFKGTGHTDWLDNKVQKIGGRYFVKFSPTDPTNMEILFDKPVPDDIFNAPDTAWSEIPR